MKFLKSLSKDMKDKKKVGNLVLHPTKELDFYYKIPFCDYNAVLHVYNTLH
jgi:hypothetical protein